MKCIITSLSAPFYDRPGSPLSSLWCIWDERISLQTHRRKKKGDRNSMLLIALVFFLAVLALNFTSLANEHVGETTKSLLAFCLRTSHLY